MILRLVVLRQIPLLIIDGIADEAALVLRPCDIVANTLHFDVFLVECGLGLHDFAVDLATLMSQFSVLALGLLKLVLEHFRITCLLFDLRLIVLSQVANAVFKGDTSLSNLLDSKFKLLVKRVKVRACLQLPAIAGNDLIVNAFGSSDIDLSAAHSCHLLGVLDNARGR